MRTKKDYQQALNNISYYLYQAFNPEYRLELEGSEDIEIMQELIDKCFNHKNYFKLKRSVTPKRNKKRTKEEIIKDIEKETFTKLDRCENEYLISIGQYRFVNFNDEIVYEIFVPYESEPKLCTPKRGSMSMKILLLLYELMEVLENEMVSR